jgi:hypothetical protein
MDLHQLTMIFSQQADDLDNAGVNQHIEITTQDAGAGFYYVIKTERWAFDNVYQMKALIEKFQSIVNNFDPEDI